MRVFGNNVDNSIDGVGAPQRAAGSTYDFDAGNIVQDKILKLPEHSGKHRRISGTSIDLYQQFVRYLLVEATCGDSPGRGIDARDLNSRHESESLGNAGDASPVNVFGCNYGNRSGSRAQRLCRSRDGIDIDIHQFFESELPEVAFGGVLSETRGLANG